MPRYHYKFKVGELITDGKTTGRVSGVGYDFETGRKRYGYFIGTNLSADKWIYCTQARRKGSHAKTVL